MELKLKICGLNNPNNIAELAQVRPDFMGFVFYEQSPRNATGLLSHEFMHSQPDGIQKVGVFVNADAYRIINYIALYNLDYVQLHGSETPEYCADIKNYCNVIKAFGVDEAFDFEQCSLYTACADYFLFDTKTKEHGGSGKTFKWELLKKYTGKVPYFLSGGLSENNIDEIKQRTEEFNMLRGIDVSSRIETGPGIKNLEKVKQIQNKLKGYELPGK